MSDISSKSNIVIVALTDQQALDTLIELEAKEGSKHDVVILFQ